MNELYSGRPWSSATASWKRSLLAPVGACSARVGGGKGTCGSGIRRALGAAHSIPVSFPPVHPMCPASSFALLPSPLSTIILFSNSVSSTRVCFSRIFPLFVDSIGTQFYDDSDDNPLNCAKLCDTSC